MSTTEMTGSEIICNIFEDAGLEYVFGVTGQLTIPILHALAKRPGIRFIHAAHESVSMGMADGYAQASGKLGVVLVHAVAGTANTMGNLYNSYNAGSPTLVIAGQVDSRLQWCDRYMNADYLPMVSQVTKGAWMVNRVQDIAVALNHAIKEATTPPRGPVFLSIPEDLQAATTSYEPMPPQGRYVATNIHPEPESFRKASQLLAEAVNPVIFAGNAVPDDNAIYELAKLAETIGAPVYTSEASKVIFPTNHPLYFGKTGVSADELRAMINSADVLLTVGSHLFKHAWISETPFLTSDTKVIQIDLDVGGLAEIYPTEVALLASPRIALGELAAAVDGLLSDSQREKCRQRFESIAAARREAKEAVETRIKNDWDAEPIKIWRVIKELADALPPNSVVVEEMSTMFGEITKYMEFSDRGSYFYCADYLGWGFPASLGVALGGSKRPVVAILGDGATLMNIQTLWTAARYQIPVIFVVLNNSGYGAIRMLLSMYDMTVSQPTSSSEVENYDIGSVPLAKLAMDFGIEAQRIETPADIKPAFEKAMGLGKPILLEIMTDPGDVSFIF
jgi:benzoylformate decarboxylase